MDSRQYDLLAAGGSQRLCFLLYIPLRPAAHTSSGIRNNAVAAELVAAVLHFYKGSGVICRLMDVKVFILL
jgi:hypothetical protein